MGETELGMTEFRSACVSDCRRTLDFSVHDRGHPARVLYLRSSYENVNSYVGRLCLAAVEKCDALPGESA
jgi:hypothetical protein